MTLLSQKKHAAFYTRPDTHKKTYDIIHRSCEKLKEYYFEPKDSWLPNLEYARDSNRQTRSERREAIAIVGQVMLNHMDMASLKVAFWKRESHYPISIELISQLANIGPKTLRESLRRHETSRLPLTFEYRVQNALPDGSIKPMVAIKKIAKLFFYHLGISFDKLNRCQEYAPLRN